MTGAPEAVRNTADHAHREEEARPARAASSVVAETGRHENHCARVLFSGSRPPGSAPVDGNGRTKSRHERKNAQRGFEWTLKTIRSLAEPENVRRKFLEPGSRKAQSPGAPESPPDIKCVKPSKSLLQKYHQPQWADKPSGGQSRKCMVFSGGPRGSLLPCCGCTLS